MVFLPIHASLRHFTLKSAAESKDSAAESENSAALFLTFCALLRPGACKSKKMVEAATENRRVLPLQLLPLAGSFNWTPSVNVCSFLQALGRFWHPSGSLCARCRAFGHLHGIPPPQLKRSSSSGLAAAGSLGSVTAGFAAGSAGSAAGSSPSSNAASGSKRKSAIPAESSIRESGSTGSE